MKVSFYKTVDIEGEANLRGVTRAMIELVDEDKRRIVAQSLANMEELWNV